jgi:hypothetical protein
MLSVGTLVLAAAAAVSARAVTRDGPTCRAIPGGAGWPETAQWAELNSTTGGRLLKPTAPGAVCHKSQPSYDAARCAQVQALWPTEDFHTNHPISVEWNNWANDTCMPLATMTCGDVGYPVYVINATTPDHVKAGLAFGKRQRS